MVPVESAVRSLATKFGIASTNSIQKLVREEKVQQGILLDMVCVAKAHGLRGVELIQSVVLVSEEWTPENVHAPPIFNQLTRKLLLTAARKLNRRNILDRYRGRIKVSPFTLELL